MKSDYILTLDLGGTKLASAPFDQEGLIVHSDMMKLSGRTGTQVGQMIIEMYRAVFFSWSGILPIDWLSRYCHTGHL